MLKEAGQAYEDANSFSAAAGVYTRAGLKDRAAVCYEKSGEYETAGMFYEEVGNGAKAAELYEKAGLTFKSGISAARAGQTKKAIGLLQRVPASDEHYLEATELLAEMFLETGNNALAVERLQRVLEGKPVAGNVNLYYWLARAHEAAEPKTAVQIYKRIQSEDFDCKDVGPASPSWRRASRCRPASCSRRRSAAARSAPCTRERTPSRRRRSRCASCPRPRPRTWRPWSPTRRPPRRWPIPAWCASSPCATSTARRRS